MCKKPNSFQGETIKKYKFNQVELFVTDAQFHPWGPCESGHSYIYTEIGKLWL